MTLGLPATLGWRELIRRTAKDAMEDDILGLAAQLSYYFFLALFPALLFLLAIASFFPLYTLTDDVTELLRPVASPEVLEILRTEMLRLANEDSGGILTLGVLGALWSSSAALVSIVDSLNRAYDITEARPWWKVRLIALGLTLGTAVFVLLALSLVLSGPAVFERLGTLLGAGWLFEWSWMVLRWPLVFAMVSTAIGLVYFFGPDADQDWEWVTPGAVLATVLWVLVSLGFKYYIARFTDYTTTYGAVGSVIVLLLWFYVSSLAVLLGAEFNAEIEHASPYGKAPGQKTASGKRVIGRRAARVFAERERSQQTSAARRTVPPALT